MKQLLLSILLAGLPWSGTAATWTKVVRPAPNGASITLMLLLTDGTIMMLDGEGPNWLRLTPSATGSYINGTWSNISPMPTNRIGFASEILQSGKVWILGGENYGPSNDYVWTATSIEYDPVTNNWSPLATFPPQSCFNVTYNVSGNIAAGSTAITNLPSAVTPTFLAGWTVAGSGIPNGTTISNEVSATQVDISNAATATASNQALVFSGTPASCFGDDPSMLLPGGRILTGSLVSNASYLYNIATNSYSFAANKVYNDTSDEEGWTKLANGKVLTYDIGQSTATGASYAELYNPATNSWASISPADGTANGTFPLLSSPDLGYEMGPSLRLLDGRSFLIGATGHTALYTPSTNTWAAGPDIMGNLGGGSTLFGADDAPAAILPNGHVILAADAGPSPLNSAVTTTAGSPIIANISSTATIQAGWPVTQVSGTTVIPGGAYVTSVDSPTQVHMSQNALGSASGVEVEFGGAYSKPTQVFDFDPVANSISPVSPPVPDSFLATTAVYGTHMLMLPNGQLLFADGSYQLFVYTPDGAPAAQYRPVVTSVTYTGGGVFKLQGNRINGQSAGAAYGDDGQMDENYPIVRLVSSTGNTYYCRTTSWSNTGVAVATAETVNFTLNAAVTPGNYNLIVSGAGISSTAFPITITQGEANRE